MNFLAKASLSEPKFKDVDFSYVEIPHTICAYRQEIEPPANVVKSETLITVHTPSLEDTPKSGENFGFCGMACRHLKITLARPILAASCGFSLWIIVPANRTRLSCVLVAGPPSRSRGTPKGRSVRPILSSTGSLVALVCKGSEKTNEIWGISVRAYKTPIDILVGNVG